MYDKSPKLFTSPTYLLKYYCSVVTMKNKKKGFWQFVPYCLFVIGVVHNKVSIWLLVKYVL